MSRILSVFLCIVSAAPLTAQNQKMNWYFGIGAAITFTSGQPTVLTDNPLTRYTHTSASISDPATGDLLFYTNGYEVMDQNHQLIKDNLLDDEQSIVDVLILENYLVDNEFYLFLLIRDLRLSSNGILVYHKVKVDNGSPTVSNERFVVAQGPFPEITAVRNCRTGGAWLLCFNTGNDHIFAYDVGATSVSTSPVISKVGFGFQAVGDLVSNQDGNLLALSEFYTVTGGPTRVGLLEVDKKCGTVSPIRTLTYPTGEHAFGLAFSANSKFLYTTYSVGQSQLVQFDLTDGSYEQIASHPHNFNELQMGPDGKIYISTHLNGVPGPRVDVIHQPELKGLACQYQFGVLDLGNGRSSNFHFPNFIQDYSNEFCELHQPRFNINDVCLGDVVEIRKERDFELPDSFYWQLGQKTIKFLEPDFIPQKAGEYTAQFISFNCGEADSLIYNIKVDEKLSVDLGTDTTICKGSEYELHASAGPNARYLWPHDGGNDSSTTVSQPGLYKVIINPGSCSTTDSITIEFKSNVWIELRDEFFLCEDDNELVKIDAGKDFESYEWIPTGDTTQWIHVAKVDSYYVIVEDFRGCLGEDGTVVKRRCKPFLYFPTAFSPNNDQLNELYLPTGQDVEHYKLEIYNVWGELVFRTTHLQEGWDGTFRGKSSPIGQYFWTCSYAGYETKTTQKLRFESGYLILLR